MAVEATQLAVEFEARGDTAVLGAITQISAASKAAEQQSKTSAAASTNWSDKAVGAAGKLSRTLTPAVAGVAVASIAMANGFEESMSRIQSLVGATGDEIEGLKPQVLSLASETARAPKELAEALFSVMSAGFSGAEAMEVLTQAAKGSAAGLGDTQTIALAVGGVVNTYGKEMISAAEATDIMGATVKAGNLDAESLAGSIGKVIPVAKQAGVDFTELGGMVAFLTRNNLNASESMTALTQGLLAVTAPTTEARTELEKAGVSADHLAQVVGEQGLVAGLRLVEQAADGDMTMFRKMLGSQEALSGALILLNADAEDLASTMGIVADNTEFIDEAFGVTADTNAFAMQKAFNDVKVAAVELGTTLAPMAVTVIDAVRGIVTQLARLPDGVLAITGLGIAALAAIAPIVRLGASINNLVDGAMARAIVSAGKMAVALALAHPVATALAVGIGVAAAAVVLFGNKEAAVEGVIRDMSAALVDQNGIIDLSIDKVEEYLSATSRFADRNQIDDLDRLGMTLGQVNDALRDGADGQRLFIDAAEAAGEISRDQADALRVAADAGGLTATKFDELLGTEMLLLDGNADLVRSFLLEQEALAEVSRKAIDTQVRMGELTGQQAALAVELATSRQGVTDWALAAEIASNTARGVTDETGELVGVTGELEGVMGAAAGAVEGTTGAVADQRGAVERAQAAWESYLGLLDESIGTTLDAAKAQLDYETATRDAMTEVEEYNRALADGELSGRDLEQANTDLMGTFIGLAENAAGLEESLASANGETFTAEDRQRALVASLANTRDALAPNDPLRQNLQGLIDELLSVPDSATTDVQVLGPEASSTAMTILKGHMTDVDGRHVLATVNVDTEDARVGLQQVTGLLNGVSGRIATSIVRIVTEHSGGAVPTSGGSIHWLDPATGDEVAITPDNMGVTIAVQTEGVAEAMTALAGSEARLEAARKAAQEAGEEFVSQVDVLGDALRRLDTMRDLGVVSNAEFIQHLQAHLAGYEAWSVEWVEIMGRLVTEREAAHREEERVRQAEQQAREQEARQLEEAQQHRQQILDERREWAESIRRTVEDTSGVIGGFGSDDEGVPDSAGDFIRQLKERADQASKFREDVMKLRKRGFDEDFINELVKAGPERSGALAGTIAGSTFTEGAKIQQIMKNIDYLGWSIAKQNEEFFDLPKFHGGGRFQAPRSGGEGLAILRDDERVLPPGADLPVMTGTGGATVVHQTLQFKLEVPFGASADQHAAAIAQALDRYGVTDYSSFANPGTGRLARAGQ